MEAWRHLLPTKEHDGHEGALHEESDDTLDSQRGTEDVTHEPGVHNESLKLDGKCIITVFVNSFIRDSLIQSNLYGLTVHRGSLFYYFMT